MHAALRAGAAHFLVEEVHHHRGEDMHSEKAKIVASAQTGHNELLLGDGGRGLLENLGNLEQPMAARNEPATDGSVVRQLAFVGRLDGGNRAILSGGGLDKLLDALLGLAADVEVIADQKQESVASGEFPGAPHGMPVAQRFGLLDELKPLCVAARGGAVSGLIAGMNDDADVIHAGEQHLLDENPQRGLGNAIVIDQRLERERPLVFAGGGDDGFLDVHALT